MPANLLFYFISLCVCSDHKDTSKRYEKSMETAEIIDTMEGQKKAYA